MRILAIDTCLNACSAALVEDGRLLASRLEPMQRGHQERLATMVREVMAEAGAGFDHLHRIGVTIGPGSFTGLRVGLAFAKGLGAALSIPVAGVGSLEALAASVETSGDAVAIINAKRDQAYAQLFRGGQPLSEPANVFLDDLSDLVSRVDSRAALVGPGVDLLTALLPLAAAFRLEAADPSSIAALAARREPGSLSPLYLRAPDARLMAS